jgi:hypothetical protein
MTSTVVLAATLRTVKNVARCVIPFPRVVTDYPLSFDIGYSASHATSVKIVRKFGAQISA